MNKKDLERINEWANQTNNWEVPQEFAGVKKQATFYNDGKDHIRVMFYVFCTLEQIFSAKPKRKKRSRLR